MKNKPFDKMTAAEKRVAIAEDVVAQIEAKVYYSTFGYAVLDKNRINQKTVKAAKQCGVCAVGAAFLSGIRLGNEAEILNSFSQREDTYSVLNRWFDHGQIREIEGAYENWSNQASKRGIAFGLRHQYGLPRITAIFKNIIANKGEFRP